MKYISWNINSIRIRIPILNKLLKEENPEVVMLQETKCLDKDFPHESIENYKSYIYGQKSYNGVAILVRNDLKITNYEQINVNHSQDARCIKVIIGDRSFMSVYVPCGGGTDDKYEYKKDFLKQLVYRIKELGTHKLIIGGDFNVAITDEDVQHPIRERLSSVLCREDVRELMRNLITSTDLMDFTSNDRFTWWDYREPYKGLRIDHVLVRGITGIQVPKQNYRRMKIIDNDRIIGPSDHVPVVFLIQ